MIRILFAVLVCMFMACGGRQSPEDQAGLAQWDDPSAYNQEPPHPDYRVEAIPEESSNFDADPPYVRRHADGAHSYDAVIGWERSGTVADCRTIADTPARYDMPPTGEMCVFQRPGGSEYSPASLAAACPEHFVKLSVYRWADSRYEVASTPYWQKIRSYDSGEVKKYYIVYDGPVCVPLRRGYR